MPAEKRRSNSCWTLKLRRKKCDERPELCLACEKLGVPCYGYSQKPEWMDGAELENAKAIEIRSIVKAQNDSMRRSRALQALGRRVQAPTAESGKPSIRGKGQVATPTSPFSLLPFRDDQQDLDTEMLDAFSDEWLFAHYVHHVIPLLLHF
jgi:hypothetical protein